MRQVLPIETIVSDPAIRSGQPFIAGTGVLVTDVAIHHEAWGQPAAQIAAQLGLTLGQVYAALAFYHDHKDEIESDPLDFEDDWTPPAEKSERLM